MEEKRGIFSKIKGYLAFLIIVLLFVGIFMQNSDMIKKMNKILNNSEANVHEIYDDTKVIEAYKNDSKEGLDEEDAFLYDTLKETIPEIIKDGMTDYEKEKAAYDWVFGLTHFSEESLNPMNGGSGTDCYRPYDVIKNHSAICVGNATTFKLMMDALDIPCMIIHSTEMGEHAWDIVQLDGEWYHVDVTFDGGSDKPNYSNFNLPDSIKDNGNWPYDHDEIPACTGTKYCYIFMNAKEVDDMYGIPQVIADARDNGETIVPITVKDIKGLTTTVANYIANNIMVDNGEITYEGMYSLDGKSVLMYQIYDWSESDSGEVPNDIVAKFTPLFDKINAAFNGYDPNGEGQYYDDVAKG
ncbi:MAG: hypothetical protein IKS99_02185 [Firmicutes bacterium]|nr:hypothetical protein [Bacillota bacterium]